MTHLFLRWPWLPAPPPADLSWTNPKFTVSEWGSFCRGDSAWPVVLAVPPPLWAAVASLEGEGCGQVKSPVHAKWWLVRKFS